jgi:carbon-monoxide dehydrogenase large subunit
VTVTGGIGTRARRKEDRRMLRGDARYVADVRVAGMKHAAILRSPHAHARILRVDATRAQQRVGVLAVLTAADLPADLPPIPMRLWPLEGLERALQPCLAREAVRYVGEPVAVVIADDRYLAEDALDDIDVEYDELECVASLAAAVAPGAVQLHERVPGNRVAELVVCVGDIETAFNEADLIVEDQFDVQRHSGVPMETRGVVAQFDPAAGALTVWGPTKVIHFNRDVLARLLNLPLQKVRFIEPDVGGGFGVRGEFYPEDFLIPYAAMRLRQPVSWVEDRAENLKACNHSRDQHHDVALALKSDGTFLGLRVRAAHCMGAYVRTHGATVPTMMAALMVGPYRIRNYSCEVACVLTNRTPTGTYRGPGRFEGSFVRERLVDEAARRLGMDPAELRLRNMVRPDEMPYDVGITTQGLHVTYDSGDYPGQLRRTLEAVDYEGIRRAQAEARSQGRAVGIGLGCIVEKSGLGRYEYARVEVRDDGNVTVFTGVASVGQGVETVLAQVCVDTLGVPFDTVTVVHGDTAQVPYGLGAFASRGAILGGNSVHLAAAQARAKILRLAAHHLDLSSEALDLRDGVVRVRDTPDRTVGVGELLRAVGPIEALALGENPGVSEEAFFETEGMSYPYGVHLAVVEVDRETGLLHILRYVIAYDVGRAINPTLVEGQLVGALAQGLGGTLLEELAYDEAGQLMAGSFMDYLMPTALEVPAPELILTEDAPSPLNPLGVKGAGEGGCVGVPAAVANAVADALGVPVRRLPLGPARVLELVRAAGASQEATR